MRITTNKLLASSLMALTLSMGQVWAEETPPVDNAAETASQAKDEVVAVVNGTEIKRSTLDAVLEMTKRSDANADQIDEKALLEDLIVTEIARQEAQESGLAEREDIQQKVDNFADKLVLNTWMQEKANALEISDEDLQAAYDAKIASMPKNEFNARHILVKTEDEAKAVIKELEEGKDFAELAKDKSTGPSGPMGGKLGWFKPDSMVKPFAEAVSTMETGTVKKEPVETQFGWHVIKLEEKRDVKLPGIDNMKPQLKRQLEQEKMLEYMQSLRQDADITVLLPEKEEEEETSEEEAVVKTEDVTQDQDTSTAE